MWTRISKQHVFFLFSFFVLAHCSPGGSSGAAQPKITNFYPPAGPTTGGVGVTVVGTDFQDGATITIDQTVIDKPSITAGGRNLYFTLPPNTKTGKVLITVRNPSGTYGTSNDFSYYFGNLQLDSKTQAPVTTSSTSLSGLATGDFDKDGKGDIVAISNADKYVNFFFGQADGKLVPPLSGQNQFIANHEAVVSADFNGDGIPEIALLDATNIQILQVDKNRNVIGASSLIPAGMTNPKFLAAVDVAGDKNLDLVVANRAVNNNINGFTNQGSFNFSPAAPITQYQNGTDSAQFLLGGDIDGDGNQDLMIGSQAGSGAPYSVHFLVRTGSLTFNSPVILLLDKAISTNAVLADFAQTKKLDLVLTNSDTMALGALFYLNNSSSTTPFVDQQSLTKSVTSAPTGVVATDVNNDGYVDIVLATGNSITVFLNQYIANGHTAFSDGTPFPAGQTIQSIVAVDINADGKQDIVATGTNSLVIFSNISQ